MKDNHTLGGNSDNIVRWVRIAREEIERQGDSMIPQNAGFSLTG